MLSLTIKQQYKLKRIQRKQKNRIKHKIICAVLIAITIFSLILYSLPPITSSSSSPSSSRQLLETKESDDYPEGYPPDLLDEMARENGGWLLYFLGMSYTFVAIALVCDEWFVPAIEQIVEKLDMTPDAAGATWMAAGGSAPELFTSFIGTFIARSNVGFGTIVGSAVFNVLFVIGCCAIFTPGHLPLTWWPFARDCLYYIFSLFILALFYGVLSPDIIHWYEALLLLCLYGGYVIIMFNNQRLHNWFFTKLFKKEVEIDDNDNDMDKDKDRVEMVGDTNGGESSTHDQSSAGVHFHASIYNFLTKDSTVQDLMGLHIVARIKGETKETFESIDVNGDGHIDRSELQKVLYNLGEKVNDIDVTECFNEIDSDGNGEISFQEFENWYLASKLRITTDIKQIFQQFDDNNDKHIDCNELRALLQAMNEDINREINDDDIQRAMNELGKTDIINGKISEQEFVDWYSGTVYFEQKQLKRQATLSTLEEEEENGIELEFPEQLFPRIMFIITAPIMYSLYYTLPDVQKERKKHLWPFTFIGSMIWLMFYSYLMVWWAQRIGQAWGVPDEVMGLTFLAAGTSVPDLLSSVIVAKLGRGDMAVSSSIGSNIFDILIGLPLPWILYCASIGDGQITVGSDSLFLSVVILIIMLIDRKSVV